MGHTSSTMADVSRSEDSREEEIDIPEQENKGSTGRKQGASDEKPGLLDTVSLWEVPDFLTNENETVGYWTSKLVRFYKNSEDYIRTCYKPDKDEFMDVAKNIGFIFLIIGFIGYFVKLMFIPINNILIGSH